MGSAATCCSHLVPGEVIKGKDEVLSRRIQEDNQNNIKNDIINDISSNSNNNHNKNQENSNHPPPQNISELENNINININNKNNNNNINSISSTNNINNKLIENSSHHSQELNNQNQSNKEQESMNLNNQEKKSEEESSEKLSQKEKESSKVSKKSSKISLPPGDQYEGETKNGKPNGRGHYISSSGEEREGIFIDGLLNGEGVYKKKILNYQGISLMIY